jgi:lipopolysaccharide transport system ATP-binding protein
MPGEVVGIIGRNGAGKSTLLKILSRITEPTTGRIEVRGRMGSLLEVGTGFHPELTGRENIYLNGSILGMTRREIDRKFDEIVAFSEIEKFLDTPVKRYSSGMYVRLAFAVAAHLEPEILIVDEVLAVGDSAFQEKCLAKLEELRCRNLTILFVTHNINMASKIGREALLLERGQAVAYGKTETILNQYLRKHKNNGVSWNRGEPPHPSGVKFLAASILDSSGQERSEFMQSEDLFIKIVYQVFEPNLKTRIAAELVSSTQEIVFITTDCDAAGGEDRLRKQGVWSTRCRIPRQLLRPGTYNVTLANSWTNQVEYDRVEAAVCFSISNLQCFVKWDSRPGAVLPCLDWDVLDASC